MRTQYKYKAMYTKTEHGVKTHVRVRYNEDRDTIGIETRIWGTTTMLFKPTGKRVKAPYIGDGVHRHHTRYNVNNPFDGVEICTNSTHMKTHYQDRLIDEKGRFVREEF